MARELTEFNPPADIEFNDFLKEVRTRAMSDFIRILVEGSIIRFIADMNQQGLDKDLTVNFSRETLHHEGVDSPTLVLALKAHGVHKTTFTLVLTQDKKRIRNFIQTA
jgi:hypothetical protein